MDIRLRVYPFRRYLHDNTKLTPVSSHNRFIFEIIQTVLFHKTQPFVDKVSIPSPHQKTY